MPSPADLPDRFAEYLRQTDVSANTRIAYVAAARSFGRWIASNIKYHDALTDRQVRDRALEAYWAQLKATKSTGTLHVTRHALIKMFQWLELPPGSFPQATSDPAPPTTRHYGHGTWIMLRDGEPFKAMVMCADGRRRTTDGLATSPHSKDQLSGSVSVKCDKRRYKITGRVALETLQGSPEAGPDDPLMLKFEASEAGINAEIVGYGFWRPAPEERQQP